MVFGGSEYNQEKPQHRKVDVPSKIRTWYPPIASPKCYRFGKISRTLCACGNECTIFFEMQMLTTGDVKTDVHPSVNNNFKKLENERKAVKLPVIAPIKPTPYISSSLLFSA